jgi:hypothetical protein
LHDGDPVHIECVRFCFLSLIQQDLDNVDEMWNHHRIRRQVEIESPTGVSPDMMYHKPQVFNDVNSACPLLCELNDIDVLSQRYSSMTQRVSCRGMFVQLLAEVTAWSGQRSTSIAKHTLNRYGSV